MNEINEDEVFEKRESKIGPKLKVLLKKKKFFMGIIILLMIAILTVWEWMNGTISNTLSFGLKTGNSVGNIINCGYSVEKGDFIYYVAPSENMQTTNIHKVKKGTSDSKIIYYGGYDIRALNIVGNKLYFINISDEQSDDEDGIDNKICKMNLDGSDFKIINDNDFAYDYYDMYAMGNRIYYVGEDFNVYKMDLNGGNRQLVAKTGTGFLAINQQYIIYNKENDDSSDYITYIRKLNGTEETKITGDRIFTPIFYGKYIYYINKDEILAKIPISGGEEEIILNNTIYNMNISNDCIYYLNYKDETTQDYTVAIFKLNLNGGEPEIIKELSAYSTFLNVVGEYTYYMDKNENEAFVNLIHTKNNKDEIRLHNWTYHQNLNELNDEVEENESIEK